MKKYIVLAVCLGILLVSSMAMATDYTAVTPGSGIKGTAHDLSIIGMAQPGRTNFYGSNDSKNMYGGGDLDRICVWCHTPHFSAKPGSPEARNVTYLPLWNHDISTATYTGYSNGDNAPSDLSHRSTVMDSDRLPGGVSRLCLSCHDGSIAVNSYGKVENGAGQGDSASTGVAKGDAPVKIDANYQIGPDLTNHHPIGFVYKTVSDIDNEINGPGTTMGKYTIGQLLWQEKMECTTCHDVHNTRNAGEKFLWVSDAQSALCLTCHLKAGGTKHN